jgi:chaperonin GroEL
LVDAIAKEGLRYIRSGVNPFALGRGLHKAVDILVHELQNLAQPIDSKEKIKQVATLSAQDENV